MGLSDCGVIYIGNRSGCVGGEMSQGPRTSEGTFQLIIELYLITIICLIGLLGNALSVFVLRRDADRKEVTILLQVMVILLCFQCN